jgi:hypothetical protein
MAMHAWIIAADDSDLSKAQENPELFSSLGDKQPFYVTPFYLSLLYFLTGSEFAVASDADGDNDKNERLADTGLRAMIDGQKRISCASAECGYIGVMSSGDVQRLNKSLNEIDSKNLNLKIANANISETIHTLIDEEELYDLELMDENELKDLPTILEDTLNAIKQFYIGIEQRKQGVFMYVS